MGHATQTYKRSLSGSLGAGMGSLFGNSGKQYYILEHKMNSKYHRSGESQEIIVDQIELGRDARCQVRFDESFQTVSRRHAAIVRDGDRWKLVQLSSTNPTFLNGKPVKTEWFLQSGDDIQLSAGGPRVGFIVPTGNKATVGSIGLSRRLSLFRQQALKPYKTAMTVLTIVLFLVIAGAVTWGWYSHDEYTKLVASFDENSKFSQRERDSLANELIKLNEKNDAYVQQMDSLKTKVKTLSTRTGTGSGGGTRPGTGTQTGTGTTAAAVGEISGCNPFVYAVFLEKIEVSYQGESMTIDGHSSIAGTGFLLSDGRFITARHVVETWYYYEYVYDDSYYVLNMYACNGGKVTAYYTAISSSGKQFSFSTDNIKCDRSTDEMRIQEVGSGVSVILKKAVLDNTDWASYRINGDGLPYDGALSENLPQGSELEILGFPNGMGTEDRNHITPMYYTCKVARQGLDSNGNIITSNDDTTPGNSGGPVFFKSGDSYKVVGIVSGMSGGSYSKGRFVPISSIK